MSKATDLAQSLDVDRPTLKEIYERTRLNVHPESDNFLILARDLKPNETLTTVILQEAENKGWLPQLALNLFLSQRDQVSAPAKTMLQSLIDPALGFDDITEVSNGLLRCLRQVGVINVDGPDGAGSGTGFLVGPDVVMTSWHVIQPLLGTDGRPLPGSGDKLSIEFDKVSGQEKTAIHQAESDDWLIAFSPCLADELTSLGGANHLPEGLPMAGSLDYAVISLQDAPGHLRSWVDLRAAVAVETDSFPALHILQHPGAMNQQRGAGTFTGWRPTSNKERLLYTNNTGSGSSGGLIVNHRFQFVGIHQGEVAGSGTPSNTGISGSAIAEDIEQKIGIDKLEAPDTDKTHQHRRRRNSGPIIGRAACQQKLTSCRRGEYLVMAVSAEGKRSGKTFTYDIMKARLPETDHVIALVDADHHLFIDGSIGDSSDVDERSLNALNPVAVAERLLQKIGADSDGLPTPPELADSGAPTWVKEVLFPEVVDKINNHPRGDSLLWVVIDNMDADRFRGSRIDVLIETLLEHIDQMPNLRIVLLGYRGKPPVVSDDHFTDERIDNPGLSDVERYVAYRYTQAKLNFHPAEINRIARLVYVSGGQSIEPLSNYVQVKVDEVFRELERA